ncbi:NAD(P)-dependent oxidoreductase [Dactylosporangium sp. NBC_01737]|uniref:NAD-dependent epimerase/dehydratase family protein n=1 Tax=Dactylosporangium sp. NBC_01737 TaxID=2975959 RepID=UPI002E0F3275|nr:NAD(P)-dependent oxidoreductase [Dactylosporangium sp. NBC_01737]
MTDRLLLTGASGRVGSLLRPHLIRPGREVRLLDPAPPRGAPHPGEIHLSGSVTDPDLMAAACKDIDLVVHLGGHAGERPWRDLLEVNIHGTYVVLEAARKQGVRRVLLASSAHVVGMLATTETGADTVLPPRPDTLYGVSKAAVEALGSHYADAYGMAVVSARIGTVDPAPDSVRSLSTWLSPGDAARLVEACRALTRPGHHIVWGVSANRRRWVSLAAGETIGYRPADDAERFAVQIPGAGSPGPADPAVRIGGPWADQWADEWADQHPRHPAHSEPQNEPQKETTAPW